MYLLLAKQLNAGYFIKFASFAGHEGNIASVGDKQSNISNS